MAARAGSSPIGMIEVGGTSLSETATMAARIVPVTNSGSAISPSEIPEIAWSGVLPRRTPAQAPRMTEPGIRRSSVAPARIRLFERRAETKLETGCWFATERPRSPCSTPENHDQYCSQSGLSSPNCLV